MRISMTGKKRIARSQNLHHQFRDWCRRKNKFYCRKGNGSIWLDFTQLYASTIVIQMPVRDIGKALNILIGQKIIYDK